MQRLRHVAEELHPMTLREVVHRYACATAE
jgi:hypothetical protein